jgi:hypothetical protein
MNKTIYLREEEGPIWERARELAGDKLSPVIVTALKRFIADEESKPRGFERIVLEYNDADDHNLPKRKAFYGKWVMPPHDAYPPLPSSISPFQSRRQCAVAVTAKGNAVFLSWDENPLGGKLNYKFDYFESLERAAQELKLNGAARAAIEKIGVPVEELDI